MAPSKQWRAWYGLSAWRRRASLQLRIEPLCAECKRNGKTTPARVADHVTPHRGDWNAFRLGKLQSLCFECHNRRKQVEEIRGYNPTIGPDGYPVDQRHSVYAPKSDHR
jgi:5-methylcytosine-specific restriction endonuclease McrA